MSDEFERAASGLYFGSVMCGILWMGRRYSNPLTPPCRTRFVVWRTWIAKTRQRSFTLRYEAATAVSSNSLQANNLISLDDETLRADEFAVSLDFQPVETNRKIILAVVEAKV